MGDMLSQEEIDALLKGSDDTKADNETDNYLDDAEQFMTPEVQPMDDNDLELSMSDEKAIEPMEIDALGEIGNISMGTAATTFSMLLNNKVTITTPTVSVLSVDELSKEYPDSFVAVNVEYKEGLLGANMLILKDNDVKKISDIMMGGDGSAPVDGEVTDLQLSAISEAMNQMIGSAATSLSSMFEKKIDIAPPNAFILDFSSSNEDLMNLADDNQKLVKISFKMKIGDIIDSEMMQLLPITFAKSLVKEVLHKEEPVNNAKNSSQQSNAMQNQAPKNTEQQAQQYQQAPQPQYQQPSQYQQPQPVQQQPQYQQPQYQQPPQNGQPQYQQQQYGQPQYYQNPMYPPQPQPTYDVRPAQFQSFDTNPSMGGHNESIELIRDVPLEITVELGRTRKTIQEILEFNAGTVIELEKMSGEAVDILINGKFIAKGEVVVIDENYGIRITDIVKQSNRL